MDKRKIAAIAVAAAVAGGAGLLGATLISDSAISADPLLTCRPAVTELLLANRISGNTSSYKKDNPIEYAKINAYLTGGVRPTGVVTHMGLGLVGVEDTCRALVPVPPPTTTTTTTTPPPPTGANLYISPTGSDANACSQASPCLTTNRAYQVASCGSVVEIGAGTYPAQNIIERTALSGCASWVVFRGVSKPTIDKLNLGSSGNGGVAQNGPDHIELHDFATRGIEMTSDVDGVLIDNIDGGSFIIEGGKNVTVQNSDWGPCPSAFLPGPYCTGQQPVSQIRLYQDSGTRTDNILIKNNVIHDFLRDPTKDDHWECVIASGGDNVTFDGNWFYNCMLYAIAFGDENNNSNTAGLWMFQNNWFDNSESSCDIWDGQQPFNAKSVFRYNSFLGKGHCGGGAVAVNSFAYGNIYGSDDAFYCDDGWQYDYNYFIDTAPVGQGGCGTNKRVGPNPYVNPVNGPNGNYHLSGAAGSTGADNMVVPSTGDFALAVDKDNDARNAPRDAGADER